MSQTWTVARRELRGYFDYPTAYILVVAFLALGLFLTMRTVLAQHVGTMRPLFDLLPWLFAVFVPAITMRSLAEERRSHTLEWLMAQPLDETDVLLGKFLGNWIVVLIALAGTVPTAVGIYLTAHADPGIMLAQYIGAVLLAALAVAVGLWASSVTRNQITAFILAASVSLLLVLIGLEIVTIGLPPVLGGFVARLSVVPHFENVARGVVDFRDVLYFVTAAGLFLVLAGVALARERLSHARGAYRRMRLGATAVAVAVIVINLLGGYLRGRVDLTRDRLFTLSPGTHDLVHNLKDVVQIKLYASRQLPPEVQLVLRDVRDLLSDISTASGGNVKVTEVDPAGSVEVEKEAASYGIRQIQFNVLRGNSYEAVAGWLGLAVTYANGKRAIPQIDHTDDLEFRIASFIASLTAPSKAKVAYLMGFGSAEMADFQTVQDAIGDHYDMTSIEIPGDVMALSPDSIRVAILAAPNKPLDSISIARLDAFINGGGSLLLLLDNMESTSQAGQPKRVDTGLVPFLAEHGVGFGSGLVFDLVSNARVTLGGQGGVAMVAQYPLWPVGLPAAPHLTTRSMKQINFAFTAPLEIRDAVHVQALWQTSDRAGVRPPEAGIDIQSFRVLPSDPISRQILAVAVDPGLRPAPGIVAPTPTHPGAGRMIVIGDSYFLRDQFRMVQQNPANLTFAANAIDWLAQDEILIRIRSKDREPPVLNFASTLGADFFKWGNLAGVPLLFVLYATLRIVGRGTRARRRWKDDAPHAGAAA